MNIQNIALLVLLLPGSATLYTQQMKSTMSPLQRTAPVSKSAAASQRYLGQLKVSLQKGTHFAVFEPNGDALWANVRQSMVNYLLNEWKNGKLMGSKQQEAFWVRCDRSTMTQNDLDNGRLVIVIGVAPVRPAEFVVFSITQLTASAKPHRKRPDQ